MSDGKRHFLVVDDHGDKLIHRLERRLAGADCRFHLVKTFCADEIRARLAENGRISVMLMDVYGPGESPVDNPVPDAPPAGFRALESLRKKQEMDIHIVVLTAQPNLGVEYQAHPYERFLTKEDLFKRPEQLVDIWDQAQYRRMPGHPRQHDFVFHPNNDRMRSMLERARRAAGYPDIPILIEGETGTGKELLANVIQAEIPGQYPAEKAARPMRVNIGSISAQQHYAMLFGYLGGSFTGSLRRGRKGVFQKAHETGAAIVLDEIGEAAPDVQVALLRMLQEKEILPFGANQPGLVNDQGDLLPGERLHGCRLIFATNQPLASLVESKRFRSDLYWRIKLFTLSIPPLRERRMDIPVLVEHFRHKFNKKYLKSVTLPPDPAFMDTLKNYQWPGNVRELEHDLIGAFIDSVESRRETVQLTEEMTDKYKGGNPAPDKGGESLKAAVDRFERDLILKVLERTNWHREEAANRLGISRNTLYKKIRKYGLDRLHCVK